MPLPLLLLWMREVEIRLVAQNQLSLDPSSSSWGASTPLLPRSFSNVCSGACPGRAFSYLVCWSIFGLAIGFFLAGAVLDRVPGMPLRTSRCACAIVALAVSMSCARCAAEGVAQSDAEVFRSCCMRVWSSCFLSVGTVYLYFGSTASCFARELCDQFVNGGCFSSPALFC